MPHPLLENAVRLEFASGAQAHTNLSGAAFTADVLWLVGDETSQVERLQPLPPLGAERTVDFNPVRASIMLIRQSMQHREPKR